MKTFLLVKITVPLCLFVWFAATVNLTGKWAGFVHLPNSNDSVEISCYFAQKDSVLTGSLTGPKGTINISNGKISGKDFYFDQEGIDSGTVHATGKYYGDSITIDLQIPMGTLHSMLKRVE